MTTKKQTKNSKRFIVNHAHHLLAAVMLLFVAAAVLLGEMMNVYDKFWWWDDMLHGSSGLIFGLVGLFIMFAVNQRTDMRINAFFVALFVMCFAIAMGVFWEIYEFTLDVFFKTTMQQWNMGSNAIVIGKDYQSMGLRDTMSDLITATIGAVIAAIISFYAFSKKRHTVRHVMRNAFPGMRNG